MLLPTVPLLAQDELAFPDSLLFGVPVDVTHVRTLDSMGTIRTELPEVQATLIEMKTSWYGGVYALAVTSAGGFDLFPIPGAAGVDDVQLSTANVRGNGHLQVVVRTMNHAGRTGWEHALHEREWRVQLWDLQERRCLLDLVSGHSHEEWTNTWVPDSTGLIPYEERTMLSSTGEMSCDTYDVSFAHGMITLVRTDDCPGMEDQDDLPKRVPLTVRYTLGKDGWLKQ